jgi:hypothetical protein
MAGSEPARRYLRSDDEERLKIIHEWAYPPDGEGFPDGIAELLSELHAKETDEPLRQELLDALVWVASGASFDAILEISKAATDEEQREAATSALEQVIEALASDGESMAWDRVFRSMEADLPKAVRVTAIEAVKNDGNASMIPRLEVIARDADPEIREVAQEAVDWLREE